MNWAKFPNSPGVDTLAPPLVSIAARTAFARVYSAQGPSSSLGWNRFRHYGPLDARWDHHLAGVGGSPVAQDRSVYYMARDAKTGIAEFFQRTRRIDRVFRAPRLVVFELARVVSVLDLTGDFVTRTGASMAIHSGSRGRARGWARDLYEAFPTAQGILYASSMNAGAPALVLNDRAEAAGVFPRHPTFHRALADEVMLPLLGAAAADLGYALR